MMIAVSVAWRQGTGYGPGTIVVGVGPDFTTCMSEVLSKIAMGTRLDDAIELLTDKDGLAIVRPAKGKMHRHGKNPGQLICPSCGSQQIEPVTFMDGWMTCEKHCYGESGNPSWLFEGHHDPDGEGPPEDDIFEAETS